MTEQPREHPVNCPWHLPAQPEPTWNASGVCDACEHRQATNPRFVVKGDYAAE